MCFYDSKYRSCIKGGTKVEKEENRRYSVWACFQTCVDIPISRTFHVSLLKKKKSVVIGTESNNISHVFEPAFSENSVWRNEDRHAPQI